MPRHIGDGRRAGLRPRGRKLRLQVALPGEDRDRTQSGQVPEQRADRGIEKVEVRVDNGEWQPATLAQEYSIDTWRQWSWMWDAGSGLHTVQVRATDLDGNVQVEERTPPIPGGATGWHTRSFTVK